jgi:ssDNA-binding Zn-finger/Zn-ribbon topoisomerase 1
MQRLSADPEPIATPSTGAVADCPVCGEPIRGIASASPGEHRFVGCDHYASARFLRSLDGSVTTAGTPVRLGP